MCKVVLVNLFLRFVRMRKVRSLGHRQKKKASMGFHGMVALHWAVLDLYPIFAARLGVSGIGLQGRVEMIV